jgi:hypothetical protein
MVSISVASGIALTFRIVGQTPPGMPSHGKGSVCAKRVLPATYNTANDG